MAWKCLTGFLANNVQSSNAPRFCDRGESAGLGGNTASCRGGALLYLGANGGRPSGPGHVPRDGYEAFLTSGEGLGASIPLRSATETASANDPTSSFCMMIWR